MSMRCPGPAITLQSPCNHPAITLSSWAHSVCPQRRGRDSPHLRGKSGEAYLALKQRQCDAHVLNRLGRPAAQPARKLYNRQIPAPILIQMVENILSDLAPVGAPCELVRHQLLERDQDLLLAQDAGAIVVPRL